MTEREAKAVAKIVTTLLDKVGSYSALLSDMGCDPGDDVDKLLLSGQRLVHRLRQGGSE